MSVRAYVASLLPGLGATTRHHLDRAGFEFFLPVVKENREGRLVSVALFPGYVFVWFDVERDRWQKINATVGVGRLLPVKSEVPRPLPAGFVEELRSDSESGALDARLADETASRYAYGDLVEVRTGPWVGHALPFSRYHKGSLKLLASLLGRQHEITIPAHHALPAPAKAA